MEADEVWELFSGAEAVLTARGKKTRRWNPSVDAKEDILADVMGRSGNLRAPTLQVGNVYLVGFNDEIYGEVFGGA